MRLGHGELRQRGGMEGGEGGSEGGTGGHWRSARTSQCESMRVPMEERSE
jgi:hypothetical protein